MFGITHAFAETSGAAAHGGDGIAAVISFLHKIVENAAQIGIVIAEMIGISILIITAVKCFVKYFKKDEHLRLELAQGIALALEFKLGGEVLHTVIAREWADLLILGAIIALRGVLTLLLHWEIKIEEDRENLQLLDQQNDIIVAKLAREMENPAKNVEAQKKD